MIKTKLNLCDSQWNLCGSLCYKMQFKPVTQCATEKSQRVTEKTESDSFNGMQAICLMGSISTGCR